MAFLSQRGMNNVVIFSMLLMIALFNLDTFLPSAKAPAVVPLIPQDAYVLKIEQGQSQLVRNGQGWRQVSPDPEIVTTPAQQISAWRSATLQPEEMSAEPQTEPLVAVVWLAGQSDGLVFAFNPQQDKTLVKTENAWYRLSDATLTGLLPWDQ